MPLQATAGAATYDAFGGGVAAGPANYIEDVFSTYLYTGNGSTQTITNGIDLSTKGGLVWLKARSQSSYQLFFDTARGVNDAITSASDSNQFNLSPAFTSFNSNGFSLGNYTADSFSGANYSSVTYTSWTFRKQPKFFDVVTYTGTGSNTTISHNLGAVPGCILVKRTDASADWQVYHRSNANTEYMVLNSTAAKATGTTRWNSTTPTSTVFSIGTDTTVNASGGTYVAYLFAHDAGGFGASGTDNVISCGSFTATGSLETITLGYEPQWIMLHRSSTGGGGWFMEDTMRGMPVSGDAQALFANTSAAETAASVSFRPTATGFTIDSGTLGSGDVFIYIAIRRGPMKTPTSGTSVYNGVGFTATGSAVNITGAGFPPDLAIGTSRSSAGYNRYLGDRLRGLSLLASNSTSAESAFGFVTSYNMDGIVLKMQNG